MRKHSREDNQPQSHKRKRIMTTSKVISGKDDKKRKKTSSANIIANYITSTGQTPKKRNKIDKK